MAATPDSDREDDAVTEAALVAFLCDPATHGGDVPRHIMTATSHLFLLTRRAFKLKRRIAHKYIDYSTLSQRARCARAELAVNRSAGALYRRVVPVTREQGALALDGAGVIVDWLVEMDRFADGVQFDELLAAGTLTPALLDRCVDVIAALHAGAVPERDSARALGMARNLDNVIADFGAAVAPGEHAAFVDWQARAMAQWQRVAARAGARQADGFVRHCHGDLHLANICLYQGAPTPFDAIEFNDALATIDVLYDFAFLLMDLVHQGAPALAARAFARYLEASGVDQGLALMPLYLSVRAAIRGMIASFRGDPADAYLATARRFLTPGLGRPLLLAIGGLSGSGKSTLASALAPCLDAPLMPAPLGVVHLRSDGIRKRLCGVEPEARLAADGYSGAMSARVYATLYERARVALQQGATVIADATFLRAQDRAAIEAVATACDADFHGVWLAAPAAVLKARVEARTGDASDATPVVVDRQLEELAAGPVTWPTLTSGPDFAAVVTNVLRALVPDRSGSNRSET